MLSLSFWRVNESKCLIQKLELIYLLKNLDFMHYVFFLFFFENVKGMAKLLAPPFILSHF